MDQRRRDRPQRILVAHRNASAEVCVIALLVVHEQALAEEVAVPFVFFEREGSTLARSLVAQYLTLALRQHDVICTTASLCAQKDNTREDLSERL
jgi:hypothetical protein